MADIVDGSLTAGQIRDRRDQLEKEAVDAYAVAPDTSPKAYKKAQASLQIQEDMTFSDDELNRFLPISLRYTVPEPAADPKHEELSCRCPKSPRQLTCSDRCGPLHRQAGVRGPIHRGAEHDPGCCLLGVVRSIQGPWAWIRSPVAVRPAEVAQRTPGTRESPSDEGLSADRSVVRSCWSAVTCSPFPGAGGAHAGLCTEG
jgi:hypothetical protein